MQRVTDVSPAEPRTCPECGGPVPSKNKTYCSQDCYTQSQLVHLEAADHARVSELAAAGLNEYGIARHIGVNSKNTWDRLKKRDPRLARALERGRARMEDSLVTAQMRRALDHDHRAGFLAAQSLLNHYFGHRESRTVEHKHNVQVLLPQTLTEEEYRAQLEARKASQLEAGVEVLEAEIVNERETSE